MKAHCDYLSLSYSPDESPLEDIKALMLQHCGVLESYSDKKYLVRFPVGGTVAFQLNKAFHGVSFSGQALHLLRVIDCYGYTLKLLSDCPHKVTRLDAAYDVYTDAADVLAALVARYPEGSVALTRKAMKYKKFLGVREDGRDSGTIYFGYRNKARVTGKVYDKTLEALEKRSELLPPTTRYEMVIRDGLATLRDAYDPTAIFWHYAAPALLPLPAAPVPAWTPGGDAALCWDYTRPEVIPMDRLKRYVSDSSATLIPLADAVGRHGRETALYLMAKQLGLEMPSPPVRTESGKISAVPDSEAA